MITIRLASIPWRRPYHRRQVQKSLKEQWYGEVKDLAKPNLTATIQVKLCGTFLLCLFAPAIC